MRLAAAVGLLVPGLMLAAGTGTAVAAASPGHTIASAGTLSIGSKTSGGGGAIDFWKVHLNGGDKIQISTTYPEFNNYVFALYAPGTTDGSFPQAATFSSGVVNDNTTKSVIDLQAPYNGTFILAVCQNVSSNNCVNVDQGSGTNPMNPYTYTTKLTGGLGTDLIRLEGQYQHWRHGCPHDDLAGEADALGTKASYRVDIDVRQFDPDSEGHAVFTAQIMIADSAGRLVKTDTLNATANTTAATGSPMVLVINNFLGQLADRIAADLRMAAHF